MVRFPGKLCLLWLLQALLGRLRAWKDSLCANLYPAAALYKLRPYPCHPPRCHHPLLCIQPFLPPAGSGGIFPSSAYCGTALRPLWYLCVHAVPFSGPLPVTEAGMARHACFRRNISTCVPKGPLPPAPVFHLFCLPVCPPVRPVFPAVTQKPRKLPAGVFLTHPSLAGLTRHGNSHPATWGL